jgi:endoglucanase
MKKLLITTMMIVTAYFQVHAALTLSEVRTASNNVLVVYFKSTTADNNEVNITKSSWKINGTEPLNIYRFVTEVSRADHFIYLETAQLVNGTEYKIQSPHGDATITFNDHTTFCEAIKTNQGAYSPLSKSNNALFAIWLGSGGSKAISGTLPEYEVFEQHTGKVVATGTLVKVDSDATSGDSVCKIDLSKVPEGGPYKIAVKGYGCSYPFGIGAAFSKRLAYISFRGQYYQRCGCPIQKPYMLDVRATPCHTTVYDTDGPIGEANIVVAGSERTFKCYGGYHDAGDADRRAYHISNPIVNLMFYETFPELFTDGQYNIPDKFDANYAIVGKGNGIPDIVDEAEWGTLIWEYLQNDDGSIHWGTETKGYPDPFESPMDKDTKKYGTVLTDPRPAAVAAGLFLHLARIMKPYNAERAEQLAQRAQKSFTFISSKMANAEKLYYYIQKYLYDGDEAAHEQVKALKSAVDNYKKGVTTTLGYSLNDTLFDNPGYIMSYILEKNRPVDQTVVEYFTNALKNGADANIAELKKHAYPVGNPPVGNSWGHNVRQPLYATAPLLYWKLTKDQQYIDAACELLNYTLGQNPLGLSFTTGIGFKQVQNPHDRESAYTTGKGWGNKPGITVFGPGIKTFVSSTDPTTLMVPSFTSLPVERQYMDNRDVISMNEFTIFETMTHYAIYTVLAQGGTWDESKDPFKTQQEVGVRNTAGTTVKSDISYSVDKNTLTISLNNKNRSSVTVDFFTINGQSVQCFKIRKLSAGAHSIPVSLTKLKSGTYMCKITSDNNAVSGVISISK